MLSVLNPASFLPVNEEDEIVCKKLNNSRQTDLNGRPLESPGWELFTDGISFVVREQKAGYAIIALEGDTLNIKDSCLYEKKVS